MFGHWNELLREVGKVIIPGSVSGKTGCGPECHGLGDKVVLRHRLDSMLSKVFSSLGDSVVIVTLQGPGKQGAIVTLQGLMELRGPE